MLMILGDFKHSEWELSKYFMAAITIMGLTLVISSPTHKGSYTLNLVFSL